MKDSKTKNNAKETMEDMDAIYKEVRDRKRKRAWEITKKVSYTLFRLALMLVYLYAIYYCWFINVNSVALVGLLCAGLSVDLEQAEKQKVENELKELKENKDGKNV